MKKHISLLLLLLNSYSIAQNAEKINFRYSYDGKLITAVATIPYDFLFKGVEKSSFTNKKPYLKTQNKAKDKYLFSQVNSEKKSISIFLLLLLILRKIVFIKKIIYNYSISIKPKKIL
ncbi:hypothetical protein [Flavobacterium sp. N1861]|uniref:hypothetical protein n=1 Tax=Flavobacterium sp. N1861 TaxID=2986825 RepID=UPI0022246811|nr:hypothetical protein [Flavobacterium sp. N1861]